MMWFFPAISCLVGFAEEYQIPMYYYKFPGGRILSKELFNTVSQVKCAMKIH